MVVVLCERKRSDMDSGQLRDAAQRAETRHAALGKCAPCENSNIEGDFTPS